jgi:uncharacterized protein
VTRLVTNTVEFPYRRSLGPVVGAFVAALGQRRIMGVRSDDRVLVPPLEYDPDTGKSTSGELVDVGPAGTVRSWTWVAEPARGHPLDRPFAFALIQLDGADTSMVHAVDAGAPAAMRTGMRVVPRFRDEPQGRVDDLACFVPVDADADPAPGGAAGAGSTGGERRPVPEPVATMEFFSSLTYTEALASAGERFAQSLLAGTILGQRCSTCGRVYVPPRDYCPVDAIPLDAGNDVTLPDRGVVTNFTIVTPVQYPGQRETEPFVRVSVLLDQTDAMLGLQSVVDVRNEEVRVGMRVEAVWLPPAERTTDEAGNRGWGSMNGAIRGWRPTGEPDLPAEDYIDRVF